MITVAIPTYNGSAFLEQTVESVILQTLEVEGILIIDDASEDNTVKKAREIIEKYSNSKMSLFINEKNIGYQANWNRCFDLCKTKYLVILHQDDMLKRNSCERLVTFHKDHPALALAGGHEEFCNELGAPLKQKTTFKSERIFAKGQIYEFINETGSYIACSSVMFNMEKIKEVGGFEVDVSGTDELYWPRVLTKYPIAVLGSRLILRRIHPEQAEYRSFISDEKDAIKIFQRFKKLVLLEERIQYRRKILHYLRKKFFVGYIGIIATSLAKQGYTGLSIKYFFKAFRIYPAGFYLLPVLWKSTLKIVYFKVFELVKRMKKTIKRACDNFNKFLFNIYFLKKLEDKLKECDTVLELGAGKFSYLRLLKKQFHITAFDIDKRSLEIAREANVYNHCINGNVTMISNYFDENSFDCVVAFDLIEHLEKEEGLILIKNMERIAKKKIIIYTPNGFLFQDPIDGNIYQKHISGWSFSEMEGYSFRVYGVNGLRMLRGPLALPRIRPYFIGYFISNLSWILLKIVKLDKYSFSILCIKGKK